MKMERAFVEIWVLPKFSERKTLSEKDKTTGGEKRSIRETISNSLSFVIFNVMR